MKPVRHAQHPVEQAHHRLIRSARRHPVLLTIPLIAALLITISASVFADSAGRLSRINTTVPPGGDTFQMQCRKLQQGDDNLRTEYAESNTTAERKQALFAELYTVELEWQESGCQALWGDINASVTSPFIPTRPFPPTLPIIRTLPAYPATPPGLLPMRIPGGISGEASDTRHEHDIQVIGVGGNTSTPAVPPTPFAAE